MVTAYSISRGNSRCMAPGPAEPAPDIAGDRHSPKGGLLITGTQPHRTGTAAEA